MDNNAHWRFWIAVVAFGAFLSLCLAHKEARAFNPPTDFSDGGGGDDGKNKQKDDGPTDDGKNDDGKNDDGKTDGGGKDVPHLPEPASVITALIGFGLAGAWAMRRGRGSPPAPSSPSEPAAG